MLALAALPLFGFVGAAIDYSRAASVRTSLQSAADATGLMLSKDASSLNPADLQTKAGNYLKTLFTNGDHNDVSVTTTYDTGAGGSQILLKASTSVNTRFMGMFGFSTIGLSVTSDVKWGNVRLRVALVLDNTGSMSSSGKLAALKTATNNLLGQLQKAATNDGDVYVSIVPFVKDVNVGSTNYQATWIDWSDWDSLNGTCSKSSYTTQSSCTSNGKVWTRADHKTWNGCVTDRGNSGAPSAGNYDTNVATPNPGILASQFPAEQYSSCPAAIMPLNYNWSAMTTMVNNMVAAGNTNQAIGLVQGWQSLVGGGPYPAPPAMDSNFQYQQAIILPTDGLNTEDRWYTKESSIDARQQMTCDNVKASGFTVYTVQVNTGNDPTSTLLQNCASDAGKFFLLKSSDQIVMTFNTIGTALTKLRIAQ
jgi:Flp pilus assembly protein TadG